MSIYLGGLITDTTPDSHRESLTAAVAASGWCAPSQIDPFVDMLIDVATSNPWPTVPIDRRVWAHLTESDRLWVERMWSAASR